MFHRVAVVSVNISIVISKCNFKFNVALLLFLHCVSAQSIPGGYYKVEYIRLVRESIQYCPWNSIFPLMGAIIEHSEVKDIPTFVVFLLSWSQKGKLMSENCTFV